jgi:hypothetical protein
VANFWIRQDLVNEIEDNLKILVVIAQPYQYEYFPEGE